MVKKTGALLRLRAIKLLPADPKIKLGRHSD
jgi:hypothetical protein